MALGDEKKDSFEVKSLHKKIAVLIVILISAIILVNILNDESDNAKVNGEINENLAPLNKTGTTADNLVGNTGENLQKNETGNETAGTGNDTVLQETGDETSEQNAEIGTIEDSTYETKIRELINKLKNYNESIFDVYDVTQNETEIKNLIDTVNDECRNDETHELDVSCAIISVVRNSKKSNVCEFNCLPSFCKIYKMHAAVYVLNQMLPDKQIFIAMDTKGQMYVLYREDEKWKTYGVDPMSIDLNKTIVLYNDECSTENKFEMIKPRYVKLGGKFCFEIYSNESCTCKIEQQDLHVGKCPQLSTNMFMSLCEIPIETFEFLPGNNKFCFEIPEDYEKGLYTYSFTFVSDKTYLGVGNGIIEVSRHNCCVEGEKLEGFVVVQ